MSSPELPALVETDARMEPAQALAAAITQAYLDVRKTVKVYVLKAGLAREPDHVAELAGEVLDEAVARAMAHADRWRPERGTHPWIAAFAANIILERRRQAGLERQRRARSANHPAADTDVLDSLVDPGTVGRDRLFELLDLVGEPARTLLRRAYVDHEPQAEIARSLGVDDGTLRVRLLRARQRFISAYTAAERGERGGRR